MQTRVKRIPAFKCFRKLTNWSQFLITKKLSINSKLIKELKVELKFSLRSNKINFFTHPPATYSSVFLVWRGCTPLVPVRVILLVYDSKKHVMFMNFKLTCYLLILLYLKKGKILSTHSKLFKKTCAERPVSV